VTVPQPVELSTSSTDVILQLQRRVRTLTRLAIVIGAGGTIAIVSAFAAPRGGSRPDLVPRDSVLVVRAISVVDARGVERVRIAAPLPDPIMLGRRFERGESVSGILIFDSEGNERGGYVTDESRHAALTLDEINRAAIHIGTNDRGEAHITLGNGRGGLAVLGMRPTGTFLALDGKRVAVTADSTGSIR
jgi:hypothetical protein